MVLQTRLRFEMSVGCQIERFIPQRDTPKDPIADHGTGRAGKARSTENTPVLMHNTPFWSQKCIKCMQQYRTNFSWICNYKYEPSENCTIIALQLQENFLHDFEIQSN